eukprot:9667380-Heterocapsa_arctica.AAC.1
MNLESTPEASEEPVVNEPAGCSGPTLDQPGEKPRNACSRSGLPLRNLDSTPGPDRKETRTPRKAGSGPEKEGI